MNRKMRRLGTKLARQPGIAEHWAAIRKLRSEYRALPVEEQAENKPLFAAQIEEHLAAICVA